MEVTIPNKTAGTTWNGGGDRPFNSSYGKMMMWFFLISDALTFAGFLGAYGMMRFKFLDSWPIADEVFTHVPFTHGSYPMIYVAIMTFILIFSSVTMVFAVDAGKQMKQKKVAFYMLLTIIGGILFLGSQAWEWKNFIKGDKGAVVLSSGEIAQFVDKSGHQIALTSFAAVNHSNRVQHTKLNGIWNKKESTLPLVNMQQVLEGFNANPNISIRTQQIDKATKTKVVLSRAESTKLLKSATQVVYGANLKVNEYGLTLFGDFFFFITGFHGFHVLSGILINVIILFNVLVGTYEKRGHYEMVEKSGLYWHFVDLVWIFVFTFFYLF